MMVRTQVQLTERQAGALRRLAARRRMSVAALIRELVDEAIASPDAARAARALAVVGRFREREGARDVSVDHDRYLDEAAPR